MSTRALLAALVAGTLALALVPTASAATAYADPTGDAKTAPDVAKVTVDVEPAAGAVRFDVEFAGPEQLVLGGGVVVALDTDRNSGTGDRDGFEYVVDVWAGGALLLKWNGDDFAPFNHQPLIVARAPGKLTLAFCSCDTGAHTFDFAVFSFRGNDFDIAPDGGATFPVVPVEITAFLYSAKPLFPKAGKRFTLRPLGVRLATDDVAAPDSLNCGAKLGGKSLKESGVGGCSWLLPKKSRGKKLVVTVNVTYEGQSETFSQTFKVR